MNELSMTCSGVHVHFQQQPTLKRFGGNPHTFAIQSQSALTSTKQDLCISRSAVRLQSLLRQAEPSCLHVGGREWRP